jgi:hypothetical protein
MLPLIRYMFVTIVFLIIYITIVAPPLANLTSAISTANQGNTVAVGVIGNLETVIYIGLPLVLLAGVILIGFIFAFGIRGTSVR